MRKHLLFSAITGCHVNAGVVSSEDAGPCILSSSGPGQVRKVQGQRTKTWAKFGPSPPTSELFLGHKLHQTFRMTFKTWEFREYLRRTLRGTSRQSGQKCFAVSDHKLPRIPVSWFDSDNVKQTQYPVVGKCF